MRPNYTLFDLPLRRDVTRRGIALLDNATARDLFEQNCTLRHDQTRRDNATKHNVPVHYCTLRQDLAPQDATLHCDDTGRTSTRHCDRTGPDLTARYTATERHVMQQDLMQQYLATILDDTLRYFTMRRIQTVRN